jgi:hypothetical protein
MSMFARCLLRGQADEKSGKPYSTVGESTLKASGFLAVFEDEPTLACSANEFYPFLYHWEAGSAWVRVASDTTCSSVTWPAWFRVSLLSSLH